MRSITRLKRITLAAMVVGAAFAAMTIAPAAAQAPPEPPARFVGSVVVDGAPAPAGTTIEARVGATTCGVANVFMLGSEARYTLDAAGAISQPGCGTDGAQVRFYVGGAAAQTGAWRNYELNTLNLSVSAATPTATSTVVVTPTPGAPVAGTGMGTGSSPSAWWLVSAALLGSLGFAGAGWAAVRRS